jgi:DNA-binding winged helix-turn-helix (wHTH) protein
MEHLPMRVAVHQIQSRIQSSGDGLQFKGTEVFRFSDCEVRLASREVLRGGLEQRVERLTFDLIVYLIGNCGRVVSKEELLRNVWRNMFVSDSVITQSIMKARRALADDGRARLFIRTVHRVGYKFDEAVVCAEPVAEEALDSLSQTSANDRKVPLDEAARDTLAKAAEVMARELTRLGLTVRPVDSDEVSANTIDMAERIGLALHQSLGSHRGLLADIASRDLRRPQTA